MKRRGFLAAIAGVLAAPKLLEQLKPEPPASPFEDLVGEWGISQTTFPNRHEQWEALYSHYALLEEMRPDRLNRPIIINLSAVSA